MKEDDSKWNGDCDEGTLEVGDRMIDNLFDREGGRSRDEMTLPKEGEWSGSRDPNAMENSPFVLSRRRWGIFDDVVLSLKVDDGWKEVKVE